MGQSITILEAVSIAVVCIAGYAFVKTIIETIKDSK
jgi:hypothetical protein